MPQESFHPLSVGHGFDEVGHAFSTFSGSLNPLKSWVGVVHPRLGFGEAMIGRNRGRLDLRLDSLPIHGACRALVGEPAAPARKGGMKAAYILTTPVPGLHVVVRLGGNALSRFGLAIPVGSDHTALDDDAHRAGLDATISAIHAACRFRH